MTQSFDPTVSHPDLVVTDVTFTPTPPADDDAPPASLTPTETTAAAAAGEEEETGFTRASGSTVVSFTHEEQGFGFVSGSRYCSLL